MSSGDYLRLQFVSGLLLGLGMVIYSRGLFHEKVSAERQRRCVFGFLVVA